eukprot:3053312-Rhodomonas_salina.1
MEGVKQLLMSVQQTPVFGGADTYFGAGRSSSRANRRSWTSQRSCRGPKRRPQRYLEQYPRVHRKDPFGTLQPKLEPESRNPKPFFRHATDVFLAAAGDQGDGRGEREPGTAMRGTDGGGWYQGAVDSELVAQLREEIENKAEHIKVATAFHGLPQILRNQWQCAAFLALKAEVGKAGREIQKVKMESEAAENVARGSLCPLVEHWGLRGEQ